MTQKFLDDIGDEVLKEMGFLYLKQSAKTNNMAKIKLTKISESDNPDFRASDWDKYKLGSDDNKESLPIQYGLTGWEMRQLVVGKPIAVLRDTRNGVKNIGMFISSNIKSIKDDIITTQNSVYKREYIDSKNDKKEKMVGLDTV